jgi:hypothetical protein
MLPQSQATGVSRVGLGGEPFLQVFLSALCGYVIIELAIHQLLCQGANSCKNHHQVLH